MKSKFLERYYQIMEEISTYLEKDNKLTHGEKSAFGTTGSSFGTTRIIYVWIISGKFR